MESTRSRTQGAGLNVRHVGFPAQADERPSAGDVPEMDAIAWMLVYAMHLTTIEYDEEVSETIRGAVVAAHEAWGQTVKGLLRFVGPAVDVSAFIVPFEDVWKVVEDAWNEETHTWWGEDMADMTLGEFDEAADHERPFVLRCAFNRHTGIHETFRFV